VVQSYRESWRLGRRIFGVHLPVAAAAILSFLVTASSSFAACGFPWSVFAYPGSDGTVALRVCGAFGGCLPHDPRIKIVGNEISLTYTQAEPPDCICLGVTGEFNDSVIVGPLAASHYTVTVQVLNCGQLMTAGSTEFSMPASVSTKLELTAFPNPSPRDTSFLLTATVSGGATPAFGLVRFFSKYCPEPCTNPTRPVGSAFLDGSGKASLLFPEGFSQTGSFEFRATYDNANYGPAFGSLTEIISSDASTIPILDRQSQVLLGLLLAFAAVLLLRRQGG
jgi:hypothetical protein